MQQNPNVYSTGTCILRARYSRQRHQQLFNLRIVVTLDKVQKGICNRDALNKRQYTLLKKILTSLRFYHSFSEKKHKMLHYGVSLRQNILASKIFFSLGLLFKTKLLMIAQFYTSKSCLQHFPCPKHGNVFLNK